MPDTFVWYELVTSDLDAAEAFYGAVVGWGRQDAEAPDRRYTLFTAVGAPQAGAMTIPDEVARAGARPGWIGYVGVADLDAALAGLTAAGGAVHKPAFDIQVGRMAVVADPQGAAFTLFQPAPGMTRPELPPGTPGTVGWHELLATDWEPAFDFYAGRFGWTKDRAVDMGPMGTYQLFAAGGMPIGGMMTKPPQVPAPFWHYYFNVEGIDAAAERVRTGGGEVRMGPTEVPGGAWIVNCADPQGALFSLVSMRR